MVFLIRVQVNGNCLRIIKSNVYIHTCCVHFFLTCSTNFYLEKESFVSIMIFFHLVFSNNSILTDNY